MHAALQDDQHWQPATFRERGAAVPFTSPALAGARARLMQRGCELVLPHPGGVRGVYIFTLASLPDICALTMHDIQLAARIAGLQALTPRNVRHAARAVAIEGAAGRAASAAAERAVAQEAEDRNAFSMAIIQAVIGQALTGQSSTGQTSSPVRGTEQSSPEQRLQRAVQKLAGSTGRDPTAVTTDIDRLADLLAGAGLDPTITTRGPAGARGRCGGLLQVMADTRTALLNWMDVTGSQLASDLAQAADLAIKAGQLGLNSAQEALKDPSALLEDWAAAPDGVAARLSRPDWLLDGWEHICLLWQLADPDAKQEALAEIALIIPPFPAEALHWLGPASPPDLVRSHRPKLQASLGRAATQQALIMRNERLRALAA